jgi:GMP synthase (glutamine-hydrolysing)
MGLCYGHQLIAFIYGGNVRKGLVREYGIMRANIDRPIGVLKGLKEIEVVWMSHGDTVFSLPEDFIILAHTAASPIAAFKHKTKALWGLQWHPEVVHTEHGQDMIRNFVLDVCECMPNWRPLDIIDEAVNEISRVVKDGKAIIALSGGVDSSVATFLAAKALGKNLKAVHVDHGLMRINESQYIVELFRNLGVDLILVNAKERFLRRLSRIVRPEEKRKIIGEEFIRVFEEQAQKIGAEYLIQGTIYPDRIESGASKHSDTIKTHHNVGGLPLQMEFSKVIDPLKDLYKDEVRCLGERLGLPKEIVWRQTFPGPGLAVRIIGAVSKEKLEIVRMADKIVCEEIDSQDFKNRLWQYFAVLTNSKSTGVKGDERAYGWTIAIRVVESIDAMTANFSRIPWAVLEQISNRIANEIPSVTRVVYDITNKPQSTIEWE